MHYAPGSITHIWDHHIATPVGVTMARQPARAAPVRPKFSSHLESNEEDKGGSFDKLTIFALFRVVSVQDPIARISHTPSIS